MVYNADLEGSDVFQTLSVRSRETDELSLPDLDDQRLPTITTAIKTLLSKMSATHN